MNVFVVLEAAGAAREDIVRQSIFVTDLANFATVNKVMQEYFKAPFPARSCVQVAALPKGGLIEVEATAVLK
jgi:reactive intermediate/imine deaminase